MSEFTDALNDYFGHEHRAVAAITEKQDTGYTAKTIMGDHAILLIASSSDYAVGDNVFYDVRTRKILGKAPSKAWADIGV